MVRWRVVGGEMEIESEEVDGLLWAVVTGGFESSL